MYIYLQLILIIVCRDLVHQHRKLVKFCRSMWYRVRHNTIDNIQQSIDDVLTAVRKARAAKIATSTISLVVGGGLTVAGLALLPVTFGGSIGLSVAGGAIGAASTATGAAAYIYTLVENSKRLKATQKLIELDQKLTLNIFNSVVNCEDAVQTYVSEGIDSVAAVSKLGLSVGKGVAIGAQGAIDTASVAIRSTGQIAGGVMGGTALALTAPIDIANIVYYAVRLAQSNKDKNGKYDSDSVCQCLIKQSEALLISKYMYL